MEEQGLNSGGDDSNEYYMSFTEDKIGYEINFTKYFYKFEPIRSVEDISKDIKLLDDEINQISREMNNE